MGAALDDRADGDVLQAGWTAASLAQPCAAIAPATPCDRVYDRLINQTDCTALAVVDADGRPLGLVGRVALLAHYARRFTPELCGRRPITLLMERNPLIVEGTIPVDELGLVVATSRPDALLHGFIVTREGRYAGIGTGQALMRRKVELAVLRTQELQRALDMATRASQAKSEFLALMSHELRTPLNAILGFSDIIRSQLIGLVGDSRYVEYAGDIHDAGRHLLSLINDILDLAKAEAGRLELHPERIDLREVVHATVRLLRERARDGGLSLETELPDQALFIEGDELKLKQVLLNLVGNAIKFTPSGGSVRVSAAALPGGAIEVAVSDTGIGIAPDHIAVALSPFGQVDSPWSRRHQGTGLGLPLAKSLVELHGGRLEIASAVDQGTTVAVRFPPQRVAAVRGAA